MKNTILYSSLVAALFAPLVAMAACEGEACPLPVEPGKTSPDSRVIARGVAATPPSAEYRRPDETLVVSAPAVAPVSRAVPVIENRPEATPTVLPQFGSGDRLLSEQERATLQALAERLKDKPNLRVRVTGHADTQRLTPAAKARYGDNRGLSLERADEVAALLKAAGLAGAAIETRGMGDSQPRVTCDDRHAYSGKRADLLAYQACLAPNRRVEIEVWYDQVVATRTETEPAPPQPAPPKPECKDATGADAGLPFRISVDGEPLAAGDVPNTADTTRCVDLALERADVQVRFDGLETTPALNVTVIPDAAVRGEAVRFAPYSNYLSFFERAEVRLFAVGASTQTTPLAVVPLTADLVEAGAWTVPADFAGNAVQYVLRVTDAEGRFDETTPQTLRLVDHHVEAADADSAAREALVGYGENHRGLANIPVKGGMVTVNGEHLAAGSAVTVFGRAVPVDAQGRFAVRQILPAGEQVVNVATTAPDGQRAEFSRHLTIPVDDWFYIALGDLTAGRNSVSGPARLVTADNSDRYAGKVYVDGRMAFYLKGKIRGDTILTASADTREQPLKDLFSNFDSKDPRSLLRRIDPDAYYPVYGDDSTLVEDAPTQGKFYVKLERGDAQVMWGSFKTTLTGTDLVNYSRGLYGARAKYASPDATRFGERRIEAEGFVADPGTLASFEEFRGTGGSLYFLRHQDLLMGSERLRVEVRDRDSGIVLSSTTLVPGQDYELNAIQGRVVLNRPLPVSSDASTLVLTRSSGGNPVFLVASYEYTPGVTAVDNLTRGGRASAWVNDHVKVGVTGYRQDGTGTEQSLVGADVTLRAGAGTYVKVETAQSSGPGNGALGSGNGGFDFASVAQTRTAGIDANAHRVEAAVDLVEFPSLGLAGTVSGYWLQRDDGYSAPGQLTSEGIDQVGAQFRLPVTQKLELRARVDRKDGSTSGLESSAEFDARYALTEAWQLSAGLRHEDRATALAAGPSAILAETGKRTDLAARLAYRPGGDAGPWAVYGIAQGTLDHDPGRRTNDRAGVGGEYQLDDRVRLSGEVTGGDGGAGGKVGADYRVSDRSSVYLNYLLDPDRADTGYRGRVGTLAAGARTRYTDSLSVYAEERYQTANNGPTGLIHAFGLDLAANDRWTWGARFETGTTSDATSGDLDRTAVSFSAGYRRDATRYAGVLEYRIEDSNLASVGERRTWLMKNTLGWQTAPDWRALARFNFARSNANTVSTVSGDYTEAVLGMAYRPVFNDRLNALFKYTYLADEPSPGQLAASGVASTYAQRSHVLSADAIYDLVPKLSVGGKIGYRSGEIRDTALAGSGWFDSAAWLGVLRLDWHVVHEWDAIGELRMLTTDVAADTRSGALVGVYRHIDEHVKLGVGYNFTDFSDDLTQLDYRSQGWFINVLGQF